MRKFAKAIILVPLGLLILVFAIANRQVVTFTFDPLGATDSAFAFTAPLFAFALVFLIAGVIVGGTAAWLRQHKWRRATRLLDGEARALRADNDSLRRQLDAAHGNVGQIVHRPPAA